MTEDITGTGRGRPDYSVSAERTAISTYKSGQDNYIYTGIPLIPAGSYLTYELTPDSGKKIIFKDIFASCDANINIGIMIYAWEEGAWVLKGSVYGFQKTDWTHREGLPVTTKLLIYILNNGDIPANFAWSASGLEELL